MRRRIKNNIFIAAVAAMASAAVIGGSFYYNAISTEAASTQTIAQGVSIGGIDVGGMTSTEAYNAILSTLDQVSDEEITLKAGDKTLTITPKDMGYTISNPHITETALNYGNTGNLIQRYMDRQSIANGETKDFSLTYTADASRIKSFLEANREDLETEKQEYGLKREDGEFIITDGAEGIKLNIDKDASQIKAYFENEFNSGDNRTIELETDVEELAANKDDLLAVKDVLGTFSTSVAGSTTDRSQNVRNGASKINGNVVYPGEVFSVDETLQPYTIENGYKEGAAYEDGKTVMSIGGGICQVSTTLYNAVIRAELEVVERSAHSMTVGYVKLSEDAAVSEGVKDFKFRNNLDKPVYIESYVSGSTLVANIYGEETRPSNREVIFESETTSQTDPTVILNPDGALPVGVIVRTSDSPHTGYTARLWKIVKVDGVEQSREIFNNSKYRATDAVYSVGMVTDNGEVYAALDAAVAANDLASAQAIIAPYVPAPAPAEAAPAEAAPAEAAPAEAAPQ
ncbi:MAG: VanW family protein [Lachnospiraceae bacterium]|nr:VanW family protein [Lachnospiraceae bacterium]